MCNISIQRHECRIRIEGNVITPAVLPSTQNSAEKSHKFAHTGLYPCNKSDPVQRMTCTWIIIRSLGLFYSSTFYHRANNHVNKRSVIRVWHLQQQQGTSGSENSSDLTISTQLSVNKQKLIREENSLSLFNKLALKIVICTPKHYNLPFQTRVHCSHARKTTHSFKHNNQDSETLCRLPQLHGSHCFMAKSHNATHCTGANAINL